jgi:hypothetical protein
MLICENVSRLKFFNNKFEGFKYAIFIFIFSFWVRVLFRHIFETCGDLYWLYSVSN